MCIRDRAMVVVGTYQISARYFFNRPSTVSEELLTYCFTWMALFASALVFGKRDHMRMGFLADKITGCLLYTSPGSALYSAGAGVKPRSI